MSAWKQIFISLVVLFVAFILWDAFYSGAPQVLQQYGVTDPLAKLGFERTGGASGNSNSAIESGRAKNTQSQGGSGPSAAQGSQGSGGGRGGFSRSSSVVVKPAGSAIINSRISALGSGVALQSVTVLAQASGTLIGVPAQSGARVSTGDVIAQLDAETQRLAVTKARLAYDDAQKTLERNRTLGRNNAVSGSQIQAVELAEQVAEVNLRTAQQDLSDRTVRAPISGQLGIIQVTPGNEITTQTVIGTIEDLSAILVNFWLPDRLVGSVRIGDTASVVPVARPQDTLGAEVTAIDNRVDASSGTFQAQARIENADGKLRPGMAFTVTLNFPGDKFIAVDPLAIQWGSDGSYIWRVTDGKVDKVPVRIVQRNTEDVLVAGSISEGDLIVTEGLEGLAPGHEVMVLGAQENRRPQMAAGGVADATTGKQRGGSASDETADGKNSAANGTEAQNSAAGPHATAPTAD